MSSTTFVDLSRLQFATTAAFHMTFPALSVGLAIFLAICYACEAGFIGILLYGEGRLRGALARTRRGSRH